MRVYRDRKLICLVGLILAFAVSLTLFLGVNNVFADSPTQINLELDHPISKMEYKELISPIDGYLWDDNAAIIQGTDNSLLLFYNGNYVKRDFTSPKQVKKLYDNYLVVSDNGTLYKVDYTNGLTTSPEVLKDSDDNNIGGNSFDLNESYLITAYTGIRVYSNGTDFTFITSIENDTDTPVHISNDNEIFYVYQNSLYKYSVSQQSSTKLSDHKPSALATVGEYLYYSVIESENSVIYRIPINGGESVGMTVADLGYDLGVLKYVSDICVKDGKLIITDKTICAVQEFEIDNANEKLIFTGFAIAKNKTAFNRIGSTASAISSYGNVKAVIDNKKITVITKTENGYGYKNFFISEFENGFIPTSLAIGRSKILLTDGHEVKCLGLNDSSSSEAITVSIEGVNVLGIAYESENFYLAMGDGVSKTSVIKMNERTAELSTVLSDLEVGTSPLFDVDRLANVYITDGNGGVTLYYPDGNTYSTKSLSITIANPKKLMVDLVGNIFVFTDSGLTKFDGSNTNDYTFASMLTTASAIDCCIDTVNDNAYFITSGEELILRTTELLNVSFDDYATENLFAVNEYVKDLSQTNALAPSVAFTTTNVNLYYLPKITENANFSFSSEGQAIRLESGLALRTISKITFDYVDFYLCEVDYRGTTLTGYVPKNFTVEVLSADVINTVYKMAKVSATTVYNDSGLTVEVTSLAEDTEVKVFETNNGIAKIGYEVGDAYYIGYIADTFVKDVPNTMIRNILVIIAVTLSLSVTSIYFINRKKD